MLQHDIYGSVLTRAHNDEHLFSQYHCQWAACTHYRNVLIGNAASYHLGGEYEDFSIRFVLILILAITPKR